MDKATLRASYNEVKGHAPAFEKNAVLLMRRQIYWARNPEEVSRSDTPHRVPAKAQTFTPNAARSRSRRSYVPAKFDAKNPSSSRVIVRSTEFRKSDQYEQLHMFIATQEFLHEIAHVASKHRGKMTFNQYFLRRINLARVSLGGLGQRFTPVYCSQYLTLDDVTASLVVWRMGLGTFNGGLYVKQVRRFTQSLGIGKALESDGEDSFNTDMFTAAGDMETDGSKSDTFRYSTGRRQRSKKALSEESIFHKVLAKRILRYRDRMEKRRLEKWSKSGKKIKCLTDARYDSGVANFSVDSAGLFSCVSESIFAV